MLGCCGLRYLFTNDLGFMVAWRTTPFVDVKVLLVDMLGSHLLAVDGIHLELSW